MIENQHHIAVLTGDIIGSTQMKPAHLERAFNALATAAETQADWHKSDLHFTRQRGDGWQVRLADPALALRSALAFRAALRREGKEFATFIAIAQGPALPPVTGEDLNQATDEPFVESGRMLDLLKSHETQQQMGHIARDATAATFVLADHISQGWTPAQAAAIAPMLAPGKPRSHTDIARSLGKSRQAVTKALDGAGFDAVWMALNYIERPRGDHD